MAKSCCEWRYLYLKSLQIGSLGADYWESMKGWIGVGCKEIDLVKFDCELCDDLFSLIREKNKQLQEKKEREGTLNKVGCCKASEMIYDLDGKVHMKRFGWWIGEFGKVLCNNCLEKSERIANETGLMKVVKKLMKEEDKKKYEKWWKNTSDEDKAREIVYYEYLEKVKQNPRHQVGIWSEMNIFNPTKEQLKSYLLYKALQEQAKK